MDTFLTEKILSERVNIVDTQHNTTCGRHMITLSNYYALLYYLE